MRTKIKKVIMVLVMISTLFSSTAFAQTQRKNYFNGNISEDSKFLPESIKQSIGTIQNTTRSAALATAMCSITNEGGGVIGVYAETTMHKSVDWAYITVYLERWDDSIGDWQNEGIYEQEFWPVNGKLTAATFSFNVSDKPSGYYYRLRCTHEIEHDDNYEIKTTKTDGILIRNAP